jgi:hypothetical protein
MLITDQDKRTEMGRAIREIYTGGEPLGDHLGDAVRVSTQSSTNALSQINVGPTLPSLVL